MERRNGNIEKLNICIDIDGTITEPFYWLSQANKYFNKDIKPEEVTDYEVHKILGVEDRKYIEFYNVFGEVLHRDAAIRTGTREIINTLFDEHWIHFVTAREEKMRDVSLEWLAKYQIPLDSITLLGSHNKVQKAAEYGCDIFIEDRYENALQLSEAGIDVLLIDCTYNKGALPSNVTRVSNWFQIGKAIQERARVPNSRLKMAM